MPFRFFRSLRFPNYRQSLSFLPVSQTRPWSYSWLAMNLRGEK
jgi:hypothetical protein